MPLRQLLYSPIPFSFAALWKYALQIALRTMSQSEPEEVMGIFCCCMMSSSCVRTSLAFFRPVNHQKHDGAR